MAKWWEQEQAPPPAARRRMARRRLDDDFFERERALEEEAFVQDREDDSQTQRALNQSGAQLRAAPSAVRGLYRTLTGDEDRGQADLQEAKGIIDREARFAPDVQRLEDVEDVGDVGAYARNAVLSNLPTMLPTIGAAAFTGGASALAGAGLRSVAKKGVGAAVGRALTARTGTSAGALTGSSAVQSNQMLDAALDEDSPDSARTRAAKATVGAITTGALDALPQISLLNRLGLGGAAKRAIAPQLQQHLATRMAKSAGKQATQEGVTETIQTVGENLTHKWVNDNVEVIGPGAFSEYLNAAVAGALVGGTIGTTGGIRNPARQRAEGELKWFRDRRQQEARPAADFDAGAPSKPSAAPSAPAAKGAPTAADKPVADILQEKEQVVAPDQPTPGGFINALYGRNEDLLKDADEPSLLDALEQKFQQIDRAGRADSEEFGIIGRTQDDGIVRGEVPYSGWSLFNAEQAQAVWETAKQTGRRITVGDAFAITSLPPGMHEQVGDKAIKAAGKYLLTGDRNQVNEADLVTYLEALDQPQRIQFMFASSHLAERLAKTRELEGVTGELTVGDVRKTMSTQDEQLRSKADLDDKQTYDELSPDPDDMAGFSDFQETQSMLEEDRPIPVSLNEVVKKLPFVDTRDGAREGTLRVTNSKGNPRDVSLASLVAQGWQAVGDGVFDAPNGVVDVVAQAIDVLQQRGMKVDPEQIKAGLWLGGDTRLTPDQAKTIRNGMQPHRPQRTIRTPEGPKVVGGPVQETPGVPSTPEGARPYDNTVNEITEQEVMREDGVENADGPDSTLRPRTRSPLGTRVDARGRLQEAETVDTEAADDVRADTRKIENDAIAAMDRAATELGGKLTGRTFKDKMESLGKLVKAAGKLTDRQDSLVRGARSAVRRIERNQDQYNERAGTVSDPAERGRNVVRQRAEEDRAVADDVVADEDFSVDDLVEDAGGPADLVREQNFLDEIVARLGLQQIQIKMMPANRTEFGLYSPSARTIWISAKRSGNARLDTILHELGHAVVFDTYESLSDAQKAEIKADYNAWLQEAMREKTWMGARQSRAPFFLKKWLDDRRNAGKSADLMDLSQDQLNDLLSFDEYLADHLARAMGKNPTTRGAVAKFFQELAAKLQELYELFSGTKYEPAPSVEAWVESLVRGQMAQAVNAQPLDTQHLYADPDGPPSNTPGQAANGAPRPSNLFGLLNTRDRGIMEQALRNRGVFDQIYAAADTETKRKLDQYGKDLSILVNLGAALYAQGRLDIHAGRSVFDKLLNMLRKVLGLPSNTDVAKQIMNDFEANQIQNRRYDGEARAFDANAYTKNVLAIQRGVQRVVQPVYDKLLMDMGTRLRETNNPALRVIASLMETRSGERAGEESFVQVRQAFTIKHATDYMNVAGSLKDEQKRELARALQKNQRPDGVLGEKFDQMKELMENYRLWYNANNFGSEIKKRKDYFSIAMDRKRVEEGWDALAALLNKPQYEADIRKIFKDDKTALATLVDRMVQIAATADISHVGEVDFSIGEYAPSMTAMRQQIMGFLDNVDRAALAEFQTDSLDAIVLGYVNQMSKKAAFHKVFGTTTRRVKASGGTEIVPNRLGKLMAAAQAQGASPEQMKMAKDFVNMVLGSYHAELNPAFRWVFRQIDKVWGTELADMPIEQFAHYQQAAMFYNNLRLLGLAGLASLIDSIGSLARGGSVTGATASIWDGIKAMRNEDNGLRGMAEYLGIVEKYALADALAATYGGSFDPQGKIGKLNNALFRFNGLEQITRHSRYAALAMGHRFLIQHATNPGKHSARHLKDLELTAADVQVDPSNPNFVVLNPKTEAALRRFVTEAVVRPQPSQRPGWHNDPNFLFAAQYKGYLYAFYTTIVGRMLYEADQGNYRMALAPIMPYLGVTVVAEMTRYAIQHPDEEDPRDAEEYMRLAMIRSGLVGPRFGIFHDARTDARYGNWITNGWIGPTGQQISDVVQVATGDRSASRTAIQALPGSAIFDDWEFNNEQE